MGKMRGKSVSTGKAHQIMLNYLDHVNLQAFKRMLDEIKVNYT